VTSGTGKIVRVAAAVIAAALVVMSSALPLWTMRMKAPQYPKGLRLEAYGTSMQGDIRELNILNHYIGMQPLEMPQMEAALYPIGIAVLAALCLLSPLHRYLRRLAIVAIVATPIFMLADLQWRLFEFGHSLDPHAPIRLKPFTPLVLGTTKMGNFITFSMISSGIVLLLVAALLLGLGNRFANRLTSQRLPVSPHKFPRAALFAVALLGPGGLASAETLQERVDATPRGGTLIVDGGLHRGPIVIRGPLTVVGRNGAAIDGGGIGSVVTIEGHDVTFRGFVVRNSGTQVTEEAAGIKIAGDRHVVEDNRVRDVYFGIHIGNGAGQIVRANHIVPGERHGARPGHGISVWHARDTRILDNRIAEARDGIYLSFTKGVQASGNEVTGCRYGMHSMYSQNATFDGNTLTANLLGAALMMSDRLVLRGNRIAQHRLGTAAYGVLLKDIGDLLAEDNTIVANRIGIYAEGVPTQPARRAIVVRNVIAGNEVGLALQSNAALTLTENRIAENLTDVRALGRQLSPAMRWSRDGRGNVWSQYRGYDADRDGIGDLPHRVDEAMDALVRRNPQAQAFLYTPAHRALEAAARMFPLYRQQALLVDEHPLMRSPEGGAR
jgi:nitrous oxidase accessory protein